MAEEAGFVASDFRANLVNLRRNEETADFTIVCGDKVYKVHKLILRLHSKFLLQYFKSNFPESRENCLDLTADLAQPIRCMVEYFYRFDYKLYPKPSQRKCKAEEASAVTPGTSEDETIPTPTTLQTHATMYTLAEKYDIPGLKKVAKRKFEACGNDLLHLNIDLGLISDEDRVLEFMDIIPYVYENTAPNEMGLRTSVAAVWGKSSKQLSKLVKNGKWAELLEKYPELGVDMITQLGMVVGDDPYELVFNDKASDYYM